MQEITVKKIDLDIQSISKKPAKETDGSISEKEFHLGCSGFFMILSLVLFPLSFFSIPYLMRSMRGKKDDQTKRYYRGKFYEDKSFK